MINISSILEKNPHIRAIGFDMDGVIFETSKRKAMSTIGLRTCMEYLKKHKKLPKHTEFFDSLRVARLEKDTNGMTVYHKDIPLPSILTAWQMGLFPPEKIKEEILLYYSTKTDIAEESKNIFKGLVELMMHAETFVETRVLIKEGIKELQKQANSGKLVFGLTNWDTKSFQLLKKRYQKIFTMFDTVIISGELQAVKPHPSIYEKMLSKLREISGYSNLQFEEILFLDDEPKNVEGAKEMGMYGVLVKF